MKKDPNAVEEQGGQDPIWGGHDSWVLLADPQLQAQARAWLQKRFRKVLKGPEPCMYVQS